MSALVATTYSPYLAPFTEKLQKSAYADNLHWSKLTGLSRCGSREIIVTAIGFDYLDTALCEYLNERFGRRSCCDNRTLVRLLQWFGTPIGHGFVTGTLGLTGSKCLMEQWCQNKQGMLCGKSIIEMLNTEFHPTEMGATSPRVVTPYTVTARDQVLSWFLIAWLSTPEGQEYRHRIKNWESSLN